MRRFAIPASALAALTCCAGCFHERPFPLRETDVLRPAPVHDDSNRLTVRPWLERMHERLKARLPAESQSALTTSQLVDDTGKPADLARHFRIKPDQLDQLLCNSAGLMHTAQLSGGDYEPRDDALNWHDYESILVPIHSRLSLAGKLGLSREGRTVRETDCIVVLPGLLGHNSIYRTKNLCDALRANGFHALAVELRGHGETDRRHPDVYYNFGVLEVDDLLALSEWLTAQPHVRRTGLVGFCWGANLALLAAWRDSSDLNHPSISERLRPHLRAFSQGAHYRAGVIAFSPTLRFEEIIEATARPMAAWRHPVLATLQSTIQRRMELKGHDAPSGSLRKLIDAEYAHTVLSYHGAVEEGLDYLRLTPFRGRTDGEKLRDSRIPVLIVHGANDPLAPVQDVAVLISRTPNPNVGALVLPGGGHVGFAAYARSYYYSLIVNFFDEKIGPICNRMYG